ncbi:MAG: glycosyltransferase [Gemmatimonadota bacterium]|nr:glycosyltransferase [Gemmatimonadota bacterium]
MRICHFLSSMAWHYGGPPHSVIGQAGALGRLGHDVTIMATSKERHRLDWPEDVADIHLYPETWPALWRRGAGFVDDAKRVVEKSDIIHLNELWSHTVFTGSRLARKRRKPYLINFRANLNPVQMFRNPLRKKIYLALAGNRIINNAACVHALTRCELEFIRELGYKTPVTVIPNGIHREKFEILPEPNEAEEYWPVLRGRKVVLYLGRLHLEKGLDILLKAWRELIQVESSTEPLLVIAGPDDREHGAQIRALAQKLGLESKVCFTGTVEERGKMALYSRADIFILPSYSEGFSNSIIESMASAKPVIITTGCNFPEVADAGVGLCVKPEPGELKDAVRDMLAMPGDELKAMGTRARSFVFEKYTWEIVARKLVTVFNCILEGREIPEEPEPYY